MIAGPFYWGDDTLLRQVIAPNLTEETARWG
ncbi:hypothetical protein SAMN05444724_1269 [Salinivibrio sp. ES.052]|nr:hypothetical protein SAMN05444724_1269 [Salinivibrio sp. ES.052]